MIDCDSLDSVEKSVASGILSARLRAYVVGSPSLRLSIVPNLTACHAMYAFARCYRRR